MILIPELETVFILTPRTGSGSIRRAIAEAYPQSILLYRHMEADGVPAGYDRWRKVGIVRNPIERLWSLYKYMGTVNWSAVDQGNYLAHLRRSVELPFSEWILRNETVFTAPFDRDGEKRFYPFYTVRHAMPENRKSQFFYLRPDLGTEVMLFDLEEIADAYKLKLGATNRTHAAPAPDLSPEADAYMRTVFDWDFDAVWCLEHGFQPRRRV